VIILSERLKEGRQLYLFETAEEITALDARLWHGSFNGRESTLQQLSPYVGKMKSGMAEVLIQIYSKPGDTVLDPFCGSGVVPLEAVLSGRIAWANDLSPYAYVLTRGKLESPENKKMAVKQAIDLINLVEKEAPSVDLKLIPEWVQEFFHPKTLREIIAAFKILNRKKEYFLTACLLGILHHVRPGFLSFPASHLVPYLRKKKYPPKEYPKMYAYRDLRSRLLSKVERAYRRHKIYVDWEKRKYRVWQVNTMNLPAKNETVDAVISSPPYFGALDYARDNRLRLWFLNCKDWKQLDSSLTANQKVYLPQMKLCLQEIHRVMKPKGHCALVLGDVDRDGKIRRTAEILAELAIEATNNGFSIEMIYDDRIPDDRRSRRKTKTTKFERILVMKKK
jgi:hypothetical protein